MPLIPNLALSSKIANLNPVKIAIEKDVPIDTSNFTKNHELATGVQKYLQQIKAWKSVNELRLIHEREMGFEYDFIVRCRPDIFFNQIPTETIHFNQKGITIPDQDHWWGYNDRFAVGNAKKMNIFFNMYDYVISHPDIIYGINAERVLKKYLDLNNIIVFMEPRIAFKRVRQNENEYFLE